MGSIAPGKIANLVVTDGDIFNEKTKVKHVFVDGRCTKFKPEISNEDKDEAGESRATSDGGG